MLRNAPLLDDGTPMPTRYWLVGRARSPRSAASRRPAACDAPRPTSTRRAVAEAHARYAAERDAAICPPTTPVRARRAASAARGTASSACTPTTHGSSPAATTRSGGGSRERIGAAERRVEPARDRRIDADVDRRSCDGDADATVRHAVRSRRRSTRDYLHSDPPLPEELTNAIGEMRRSPRRPSASCPSSATPRRRVVGADGA